MKSPLYILHLEDDLNDAELIQYALKADGITSTILRVQTRDDFVAALEGGGIDLILICQLLTSCPQRKSFRLGGRQHL
jgi:hypothetical protein